MSKKVLIIITIFMIVIAVFFAFVIWNSNDGLMDKNLIMENEIRELNIKVEELNETMTKSKQNNEELESEIVILEEVKKLNLNEIQILLNEARKHENEIKDQKSEIEQLSITSKKYKHENIINVKNMLINTLKLGLSKDRTLEILGNEYQDVYDEYEEFTSSRFDLLATEAYSYNDIYGTLDIPGMMDDKVGIVVFINWTTEDTIWHYTILYKNVSGNSIWEYRTFANEVIRETQIYKE